MPSVSVPRPVPSTPRTPPSCPQARVSMALGPGPKATSPPDNPSLRTRWHGLPLVPPKPPDTLVRKSSGPFF